jgi:hypothetical protein
MGPYDFDQYQGRLYRIFEGTVLEGVVTNHIDGGFSGPILVMLTTQDGGALTQLGLTELSAIALFTLISMVINWNTSGMTLRFHTHPVRAGDMTHFLLRLILCCLLINYWVNPLQIIAEFGEEQRIIGALRGRRLLPTSDEVTGVQWQGVSLFIFW